MRIFALVLLLAVISACENAPVPAAPSLPRSNALPIHALQLTRNIAPGEVIQPGDIAEERLTIWTSADLATDPAKVVGHKALKPLVGSSFCMKDVER